MGYRPTDTRSTLIRERRPEEGVALVDTVDRQLAPSYHVELAVTRKLPN